MQTFLPYPNFQYCAYSLDYRRLGKQRVEAYQLMQAITEGSGWSNHPAAIMWRGHLDWLNQYAVAICREWRRRGYLDNMLRRFPFYLTPTPKPWWLGVDKFHSAHRARLLDKDPEFYGRHNWPEQPSTHNMWPCPNGTFRIT